MPRALPLFLAGALALGASLRAEEPVPATKPADTPVPPVAETPAPPALPGNPAERGVPGTNTGIPAPRPARGRELVESAGINGATESPAAAPAEPAPENLRPVETWVEAQIELARRGFSGGSIDGVRGPQSAAALRAFQRSAGLAENGELDRPTRENLLLTAPAFTTHTFHLEDLALLQPLAATWLGKSEQTALAHATALEAAAERYHASPNYLRRLNPGFAWDGLLPGATITVPAVERATLAGRAARLHVRLAAHELEATDDTGRVIAHFPVSIARDVEKRPVGELHVTVVIPDPNYTFDPEVFPESAEAKELGRKLILAPGPNNPVGVAWIGLDRTGYGIHGTPDPEKVGRTESHGCLRLANWDARTLLELAWTGLPVTVEP